MLYALMFLILSLVIPEAPTDVAVKNVEKYFKAVAMVESNMNRYAISPTSTSSSYFQMTIPAFNTAKRRAARMGVEVEAKYVGELNYKEQMGLQLIDLYQRKGTNPYIKLIATGNVWAAKQTYYKFHHTKPDEATKARAERIFKEVYYADTSN